MTRTLARTLIVALLVAGCHRGPAPPPTPPTTIPAPVTPEVCGNCKDDDAVPSPAGDELTVNARFPAGTLTQPNPLLDDVTVQVRAGKKPLLCGTIGHQFWTKSGETYRFRPRGSPGTGGLPETFVRVLPTGAVAVRITTVRPGLAHLTDADWRVTLRIADGCGSGTAKPTGTPAPE
jgi:hypothetical protein